MLKKIICILSALTLLLSLAACGGDTNVAMDASGNVSSNGGAVVETADYVYFINGVESYSTAYNTGEVLKGALQRVKKSDLAALSQDKAETVVSKLLVAGDKTAGVYIYGEYVYYAVPSAEKDSSGNVKSNKLLFFRTKLDGTSTSSKIADRDFASDVTYRYISSAGYVYLAVYNSDGLYVYDAAARKLVYSYEKTIDELAFDEDNASPSIYFTVKPVNPNLYDEDSEDAKQASYQDLMRYGVGDDKATVALSGAGKYVVSGDSEMEQNENAPSLTGVTIDILKYKNGKIYLSYTSLDTTVPSTTYAYFSDNYDKAIDKNLWNEIGDVYNFPIIGGANKNASKVFTDSSYFYVREDKDNKLYILFIDSTYGLMQYDPEKSDDPSTDFGVTTLKYSEILTSATISFVSGEYLYFYDSSDNLYRINVKKLTDGEDAEEVRLNTLALDKSWYRPEVVSYGGKDYVAVVYSESVYGAYNYVINATDVEAAYTAATEDEKKDFYTFGGKYEDVEDIVKKTLLGKMTDADKETYESYIEDLDHRTSEN